MVKNWEVEKRAYLVMAIDWMLGNRNSYKECKRKTVDI